MEKVPYMLILGGKEEQGASVAVRKRSGKDLGAVPLNKFVSEIKGEIESKSLT